MKKIQEKTESTLLRELASLVVRFEADLVHDSFSYSELVWAFHQYMPSLTSYSPLNLYANPLSQFIGRHIGNEIPGCIQEEYEVYEKTKEFKMDMDEIRDYYISLIKEGATLSQEEFKELSVLALVDDNGRDFVKFLLGQIIEGKNTANSKISNALMKRYFGHFLSTNELYCQKNTTRCLDIDEHFYSKIISSLYSMYYGAWRNAHRNDAYYSPKDLKFFEADEYFRKMDEAYYEENKALYAPDVDCHLKATAFLGRFLSQVSPVTYKKNKDWLSDRIDDYSERFCNRMRVVDGTSYNIDELFSFYKDGEREEKDSYSEQPLQKRINVQV